MDPVAQQPVAPIPPVPVVKKGGMNIWMIISLLLFILLVAGGAYYFGKMQGNGTAQILPIYPSPKPAVSIMPVSSPASSTSAAVGNGTVTGTLCYPSSLIPAGTITAKDTLTSKETTQSYAGTQAGASTTYTMQLPVGTYHMKYAPTQYPTVIGYYTDYSACVGNPSGLNCSGQKLRPLLPVTVTTGGTVSNVNLCDFYYPSDTPPQF